MYHISSSLIAYQIYKYIPRYIAQPFCDTLYVPLHFLPAGQLEPCEASQAINIV